MSKHEISKKNAAASTNPALQRYLEARGLVAPQARAAGTVAILCDRSSSMKARNDQGQTRYAQLLKALKEIWTDAAGLSVYEFDTLCSRVKTPADLKPPAFGSTALDNAIETAANDQPAQMLIICDGNPNSEEAALHAARKYGRPISTLFVGNPDDTTAKQFMRKLAKATGGRADAKDLTKQLAAPLSSTIKGLLPG